jgi:hypothetical protein
MGKRLDLVGKRFGRLEVLEDCGNNKFGQSLWLCKCDCGNEKQVNVSSLRNGSTLSCGCLQKEVASKNGKKRFVDLSGKRFGRLVVIKLDKRTRGRFKYICKCDCGNEVSIFASNLQAKGDHTRSCGCFWSETIKEKNTVHGKTNSKIYAVWRNMMQRCYDKKNQAYKNYGGRGIKVDQRWHTFENFYKDVGDPPKDKTLDRTNNDGIYEPDNWRWATRSQQNKNRRTFKRRSNRCR